MKKKLYCEELDKWFESIADASRETGVSESKIRYYLKNFPDNSNYTWRDEAFYCDILDTLCTDNINI